MSRTSATPGDRGRDVVGASSVLGPPPATIDPDWRERIEIAKRVRDETRKARGDKPSTFDMRGPPIWIRRRRTAPLSNEAVHTGRYERQRLIREYRDAHDCRLAVMRGVIFPHSVPHPPSHRTANAPQNTDIAISGTRRRPPSQ